jgi:hypothetical protein
MLAFADLPPVLGADLQVDLFDVHVIAVLHSNFLTRDAEQNRREPMRPRWLYGREVPRSLASRREFLRLGALGAGAAAGLAGATATGGLLGASAAGATTLTGLSFALQSPVRAYDSRDGNGPLATGGSRTVGLGSAGVPTTAKAVLLNLTIVNTRGGGYLALVSAAVAYPGGFSHINWYGPGQVVANNVTVGVPGQSGAGPQAITVYCEGGGATDFLIDVQGYYQ